MISLKLEQKNYVLWVGNLFFVKLRGNPDSAEPFSEEVFSILDPITFPGQVYVKDP